MNFVKPITLVLCCICFCAQAEDAFFKNPVLTHRLDGSENGIASLRSDLAYIMSLSDEEILKRMPVQVPRIHNACPNCRKGKKERDES